jgi:predicted DNA-binding protein YlxM (UPF0122 family)
MEIDKIVNDYFVEDKSYRQIGDSYGVSKQAVHAFVNRNKREFRQTANKLYPILSKEGMELHKKIKMKRKLVGLSQEKIAEQLGTSKQYVCGIEKGKIKSGNHVTMICDLLEID